MCLAATTKKRRARRPRNEFRAYLGTPADRVSTSRRGSALRGCQGTQRTIIRTHVTKRLEMEEAKLYVVEEVRYHLWLLRLSGRQADGDHAKAVPQAVEKSPFGPSILAWAQLVTWKFPHHRPVYRQQELLPGADEALAVAVVAQRVSGPHGFGVVFLERLIRQKVYAVPRWSTPTKQPRRCSSREMARRSRATSAAMPGMRTIVAAR